MSITAPEELETKKLDVAEYYKKIENLIVGTGANDFHKLEQMVDIFCPFEATGMVRQEIKHSHFLAYILDPNRPHNFGSKFLKEFLFLILQEDDFGFSR